MALIKGGTGDGICARTCARLAGVGLRAHRAVVAGCAIGFIGGGAGACIAIT